MGRKKPLSTTQVINRLVVELKVKPKKQRIKMIANDKGRYIEPKVYSSLKQRKYCSNCGKKLKTPPEIHHKTPHRHGGSNDLSNLVAVCKGCHRLLDNRESEDEKWEEWSKWEGDGY